MTTTPALTVTLREARAALGMSLRDVERATEGRLRSGYLSQLERGLIKQPTPDTLSKLADLYGLDYTDLLAQAGHRVPTERTWPVVPVSVAGMPLRALQDLDDGEQEELRQFVAFLRQRRRATGQGIQRHTTA